MSTQQIIFKSLLRKNNNIRNISYTYILSGFCVVANSLVNKVSCETKSIHMCKLAQAEIAEVANTILLE